MAETVHPGDRPVEITKPLQPLEFGGSSSLLVNGEVLTPKDGIEIFKRALTEGHNYILAAIDREFEESKIRFPNHTDIFPPPIDVMILNRFSSKTNRPFHIFTEEAYFRGSNPYTDPKILKEEFRPFWQAVEEVGFRAQVWDRYHSNLLREIVLMARLPDLPGASYGGVKYDPE